MVRKKHISLELEGNWKYKIDKEVEHENFIKDNDYDFSGWKDMHIPNNWILTEVGDYYGSLWFVKEFDLPDSLKQGKLYLKFHAVDYIADVWLNGKWLGSHEGYFSPFEFDVTDKLNMDGKNIIIVKDAAPRDETEYISVPSHPTNATPLSEKYRYHQAKEITQIKGHLIDAMHRPGSMTSFRQDGCTGGIWNTVELISRPEVYISKVRMFNKIEKKKDWLGDLADKFTGRAMMTADVTMVNTLGAPVLAKLSMNIAANNFDNDSSFIREREVFVKPGENTYKIVVTIDNVKLWNTWDHGYPHLYDATIALEGFDEVVQITGVKEVIHDETTGHWYVNGKKIFLRGMRYIASQYMSEANREFIKKDLDLMLDMKINSIRIGSHMEKDEFYTLCDEMGFLVWQVFPLHYCVSDSDSLIERASDMIRDMGNMLVNHASLGIWSVFKEPEIYGLPDIPNNYWRLCEVLKETLATVDPNNWIHKGDYREGVQNLMIGLCQDGNLDMKKIKIEPNIVEFGAASIPCLETLKTFIPEDKLWPPDWDTWQYWGLFYDLTFRVAGVEMGDSLEEFIDNTQTYEAKVVKEQIEFLRQRKYQPVGSMYLYYWSDAVAMIGSGLLDYYRRPYKVYDSMKAVYTPILVSFGWNASPYIIGKEKIYNSGTMFTGEIWVTNDLGTIENAKLSWKIVNDKDEVKQEEEISINISEDSSRVSAHVMYSMKVDDVGEHKLVMEVCDSNGEILSENYFDFTIC